MTQLLTIHQELVRFEFQAKSNLHMSQIAEICVIFSGNLKPNLADISYMVCLNVSLLSNLEDSESGSFRLASLSLYAWQDSYGYIMKKVRTFLVRNKFLRNILPSIINLD